MRLDEYEDYLFSSCCVDWREESRKQEKLKKLVDRTDRVRITASDTDISFSIKGFKGIKCDGRYNIPDGEVFTAPVRDSVEGHITTIVLLYQRNFSGVTWNFPRETCARILPDLARGAQNGYRHGEGAAMWESCEGVNPRIRVPMRTIFLMRSLTVDFSLRSVL
jgi:aminopeptidase